MYRDFKDAQLGILRHVLPLRRPDLAWGFNGTTERADGELVSGTYFPVLGVGAAIGRTFTPDDDRIPDGHPVAMLSYAYWQSRFAGDRSIVGKTVARERA